MGGFDDITYQPLLTHPKRIDQLAQQILMARFLESIQRILANQLGFDFVESSRNREPASGISNSEFTIPDALSVVTAYGWMVYWLILKQPISIGKPIAGRVW